MKIKQPINSILLIFYKLSFVRKIIYAIFITRFYLISRRYNLKTAFYLSSMTLLCCLFWYEHVLYVLGYYKDIHFTKTKKKILEDCDYEEDFVAYFSEKGFTQNLTEKFLITTASDGFSYFIDPISMFISLCIYFLPEVLKTKILAFHLSLYTEVIPLSINYLLIAYDLLVPLYTYSFLLKVGRTICPYFIRWHWTFIFFLEYLEKPYVNISRRAAFFRRRILLPKAESIKEYPIRKRVVDRSKKIVSCIKLLYIFHLLLLYWGLFSAICGQYFYCPIMTDNVEYSAGYRPKNNIYTLGKTPWQDRQMNDVARPEILRSKNILIFGSAVLEGAYLHCLSLCKGTLLEYIILTVSYTLNFFIRLLVFIFRLIYLFIEYNL